MGAGGLGMGFLLSFFEDGKVLYPVFLDRTGLST